MAGEEARAAPCEYWAGLRLHAPKVMAILNVTPDSFSDGGRFTGPAAAIAAGLALREAGADIVDVGGESTRPGAVDVEPAEEIRRVVPVVRGLAAAGVRVSVDTRNAVTMAAALDAGAALINDVSALRHDPAALPLIAARGCPVILMHMRGTPQRMNTLAVYKDVAAEVLAELRQHCAAAIAGGIDPGKIAVDPGIGFAKLGEQNIELLRGLGRFAALGAPVVVGVSRKRFLSGFGADPRSRLAGSVTAGLYALTQGAHILRVHDVAETVQAIKLWQELTGAAVPGAKTL